MSIAASREPRLSKPGPSIADPGNTAPPATASHRAAAAAAEAGRRIQAEISTQTAAEGSPVITPPPETPISTTNSTGNTQPLTLSMSFINRIRKTQKCLVMLICLNFKNKENKLNK